MAYIPIFYTYILHPNFEHKNLKRKLSYNKKHKFGVKMYLKNKNSGFYAFWSSEFFLQNFQISVKMFWCKTIIYKFIKNRCKKFRVKMDMTHTFPCFYTKFLTPIFSLFISIFRPKFSFFVHFYANFGKSKSVKSGIYFLNPIF